MFFPGRDLSRDPFFELRSPVFAQEYGSGVSVSIETSRRLFDHTTMLVMCSLATTYCLLTRQNARGSMSSQMLSSVLL